MQPAVVQPPSRSCTTSKRIQVVLNCTFLLATFSVARVNFQRFWMASPWLDTIPQALKIRAENCFRAFLHAFFLPGSLSTFFALLPPAAGGVLPSVADFVSVPRNSPPSRKPVLTAAIHSRPLTNATSTLSGPAFARLLTSTPPTSGARGFFIDVLEDKSKFVVFWRPTF